MGGGTGGIGGVLNEYELLYDGQATAVAGSSGYGTLVVDVGDDLLANRTFLIVGERTAQETGVVCNGFVIYGKRGSSTNTDKKYVIVARVAKTYNYQVTSNSSSSASVPIYLIGSSSMHIEGTYNYSIYALKT